MSFKTFGEWLRNRRVQLDISPFKIAEGLGYKRVSAIYNFEYGLSPLPMAKWATMARILDLPLEALLAVMERYNPQKVNEFRAIQATESNSNALGEIPPMEERVRPEPLQETAQETAETYGEKIRTYHLEGAKIAIVHLGICDQNFFSLIDEIWKQGHRIGMVNVLRLQPFPGDVLVEELKHVSIVGVLQPEAGHSMASLVKAAFLDALTGVTGYPHLHRVPKIYTCISDQALGHWGQEDLEAFLRLLERGGDVRQIRLVRQAGVRT